MGARVFVQTIRRKLGRDDARAPDAPGSCARNWKESLAAPAVPHHRHGHHRVSFPAGFACCLHLLTVHSLWDILGDGEITSIAQLASDHFQRTSRPLRVAVDQAGWRFSNLNSHQVRAIRDSNTPCLIPSYLGTLELTQCACRGARRQPRRKGNPVPNPQAFEAQHTPFFSYLMARKGHRRKGNQLARSNTRTLIPSADSSIAFGSRTTKLRLKQRRNARGYNRQAL